MTIKDFKYAPFTIKLKTPFQTSSQVINERKGVIIKLTDELGNISFGECSPFPGLSSENIEEVIIILNGLSSGVIGLIFQENAEAILKLLSELKLSSSLHFALEQAILSLAIKRNKKFIKEYFGTTKTEIDVNAVLGFDPAENVLSEIELKLNLGYSTFKLKVGRENFEDDLQLIKKIREKFGDKIKLRLDANGKWKQNDVRGLMDYRRGIIDNVSERLNQISQFDIEYVEEPCNNLNSLIEISKSSPVPISVDESIHSIDDALRIINNSKIDFLILKPMIWGGIISSLDLIKKAEERNKKIIISSSFESVIGKGALVFLASLTNHTFAHGLDTSEFFEKDICTDPFKVEKGKITFEANNYPPQLEHQFL